MDDTATATARDIAVTASLTAAGIIGRVALQGIPSVATVLPIAIAVGHHRGPVHGAASGASGYYLSNFLVWGGQGPLTLFQCLGAGLGGWMAGVLGSHTQSTHRFVASLVIGTVLFEAAVNLGSFLTMGWLLPTTGLLLAALPFGLIHLVSTLGFGLIIHGGSNVIDALYH